MLIAQSIYQLVTKLEGPKCPDDIEVKEDECLAAGLQAGALYQPDETFFNVYDWGESAQTRMNVFGTLSIFRNMTDLFHVPLLVSSDFTPCGCFLYQTSDQGVLVSYDKGQVGECKTDPNVIGMVCKEVRLI